MTPVHSAVIAGLILIAGLEGLPAGIMRAGTIYATRLGVYEHALQAVAQYTSREKSRLDVKILTAMPVTVLSMILANPWDVLKVSSAAATLSGINRRCCPLR